MVPRCREQRPQCDVSGLPKSGRGSPAGPCPFVCAGGVPGFSWERRSRRGPDWLAPGFSWCPLVTLVSWWFACKRQGIRRRLRLGSAIEFTTSPPPGDLSVNPGFAFLCESSRLCAFAVRFSGATPACARRRASGLILHPFGIRPAMPFQKSSALRRPTMDWRASRHLANWSIASRPLRQASRRAVRASASGPRVSIR